MHRVSPLFPHSFISSLRGFPSKDNLFRQSEFNPKTEESTHTIVDYATHATRPSYNFLPIDPHTESIPYCTISLPSVRLMFLGLAFHPRCLVRSNPNYTPLRDHERDDQAPFVRSFVRSLFVDPYQARLDASSTTYDEGEACLGCSPPREGRRLNAARSTAATKSLLHLLRE